jgi:hypothetical protein
MHAEMSTASHSVKIRDVELEMADTVGSRAIFWIANELRTDQRVGWVERFPRNALQRGDRSETHHPAQ